MSRYSGYVLRLERPEDVRTLRQLLLGLDEPEPIASPVFRELSAEWLRTVAKKYVQPENERRHLDRLNRAIGHLCERNLLPVDIERALAGMTELGPESKNKIRSTGNRCIKFWIKSGRWRANNPFSLVDRYKVPTLAYETLSLREARAMLRRVREDRHDLFRVTLGMGLRNGEAFALRKEDVDLVARVMHIHRSHGRNQTKTSKPRRVPIPLCVAAAIRHAMDGSASELVFPREDGTRFRADTKLTRVLKVALAAAGVVLGYDAKCRRNGCGYVERVKKRELKPCPECGFKLWLSPVVKRIRFYDLRHSCVTLHREAGCDPLVIQLLLGHHLVSTTDAHYTHLSFRYQREQLDKLQL